LRSRSLRSFSPMEYCDSPFVNVSEIIVTALI
jgi:hypothetical protein